ncbi:MAG: GxxExxY protein [Parabacteroides sp.]|nr:GxxExxY protein [Parabacteroides sp.]
MLYEELTEEILGAYYDVYRTLGYGFLEQVYQNALFFELQSRRLACEAQKAIDVYYCNRLVGKYYADIVVEGKVILELKATPSLQEEHECQLINYLRATDMEVGLLMNFGKRPEVRRKIFTNERKRSV